MIIRVVVADDEPLVLAGLGMILDSDDEIDVVAQEHSGSGAVAATRSLTPDVVVMDVRMPGVDGVEATRQILTARPQTQVMMLTTFDVDQAVYGALRAGATGFMLKHAAPNQLLLAVKALAAGNGWLDPVIVRKLIAEFAHRSPEVGLVSGLDVLTPREVEILTLIATGLSNLEIATQLTVTEGTVKTHASRIFAKLGVRDRAQATIVAYRLRLVRP